MPDRAPPLAHLIGTSPQSAAVQLTALSPVARFIIRGEAGELAAKGIALPMPCRACVNEAGSLLWLGPDEFLLLAPAASSVERLRAQAGVVDVSHRDVGIRVAGGRAAWVLNALCALDLHLAVFPVGMCTRTLLAKAEIVLWRTDSNTFQLEVGRSFAPYVWACLEEARREFLGSQGSC